MNTHKERAIQAVKNMKGDDLFRARAAFCDLDEQELNEQYGKSGKTRAQIIAGYEAYEQACDDTLIWLEGVADDERV